MTATAMQVCVVSIQVCCEVMPPMLMLMRHCLQETFSTRDYMDQLYSPDLEKCLQAVM